MITYQFMVMVEVKTTYRRRIGWSVSQQPSEYVETARRIIRYITSLRRTDKLNEMYSIRLSVQ